MNREKFCIRFWGSNLGCNLYAGVTYTRSFTVLILCLDLFCFVCQQISLMSIPASEEQSMTAVLELSPSSLACPEGICKWHIHGLVLSDDVASFSVTRVLHFLSDIVHLSCRGKKTAEEDFKNVTELLFQNVSSGVTCIERRNWGYLNVSVSIQSPHLRSVSDGDAETTKPKILWSLFFNQRDTSDSATHSSVPENLFVVGGPDLALDFDYSIEKVRDYILLHRFLVAFQKEITSLFRQLGTSL